MGSVVSFFSSRAQFVVQSDSPAAFFDCCEAILAQVWMNALAADVALVLDELEADFILTQHIQGVLNVAADAMGRLSQGASIPASLVKSHRSPCGLQAVKHSTELGPNRMSCTCAEILVCGGTETFQQWSAQTAVHSKNSCLTCAKSESKFKQSLTKTPGATTRQHVNASLDQTGKHRWNSSIMWAGGEFIRTHIGVSWRPHLTKEEFRWEKWCSSFQ